MSYEEFKKRIDTMCDILVGAVPSPAGQIDQITYALMYKFMNDIDEQSAAMGGKRKYFTGDYEKYNWHRLMEPGLEAHDRLELYRQAVQTMSKNPNIPPLFRDIYERAFLPFNSASVLTLFLKEIDNFSHGHSDDIGDAYEYLLSRTGAQGEVGQFRTPRHIIKFIVKAVNPTKTDSVLDPACGTAGFLIAAYNHVRSQHDGLGENGNPNNEKRLTSDDKDKLHSSYHGFDIDPTMVRTASVNMYLHNFTNPDIRNHDTLSSEDFWDDKYDVILANPPFMTPKGGIQPHRKFSVKANRAEVLFVDYIANHLKPTGRAGIIVPEGIIFQSGNAYKQLRKSLIENSLYAVVSLPSGVFNPYAGVKTSVLMLDKKLAKERDDILFVKIENDGLSLGAQRRKVNGTQLPEALEIIERYKNGEELNSELAHAVKKQEIINSSNYNLSGDRYKTIDLNTSDFETIELGEFCEVSTGNSAPQDKSLFLNGKYPFFRTSDVGAVHLSTSLSVTADYLNDDGVKKLKLFKKETILFPKSGASTFLNHRVIMGTDGYVSSHLATIRPDPSKALSRYVYYMLTRVDAKSLTAQQSYPSLKKQDIASVRIPLPPLEIQREIVAELNGYQTIIDSAQKIISTYKPTIKINPEWEMITIGDICEVGSSKRVFEKDWKTEGVPFYRAREIVLLAKNGYVDNKLFISHEMFDSCSRKYGKPEAGDIMVTGVGTLGVTYLVKDSDNFYFKDGNIIWLKEFSDKCDSAYLERLFTTDLIKDQIKAQAAGGTVGTYTITAAKNTKIPLPPLEIQREIVAELESEQKLITANKKLIKTMQSKIKSKLTEVWGE